MRIVKSLVAMGAVAATATALAVAPALADPVNGKGHAVTAQPFDVVAVGSATTQYIIDGMTEAYNKTVKVHNSRHPFLLSWDATPPGRPADLTQMIHVKKGCASNLRPAGSSAGIVALGSYGTVKSKGKTYPCVNVARSSRAFKTGDPVFGPGGDSFVILAKDAVTYSATKVTNVPNNLNTAQLAEIFGCSIPAANGFLANTWGALLGAGAKNPTQSPAPVLPQSGSGTLSFFTGDLGIAQTEPTCGPAAAIPATQDPEENEGVNKIFRVGDVASGAPNPNVIYPFSVADFISQEFHSAKCGKRPTGTQNKFGCDQRGVLFLDKLNGTGPTVTVGSGKSKTVIINPKFSALFQRFIYNVVPWSTDKTHIPSSLEKWFNPATGKGTHGWFCLKAQRALIRDYGFSPTAACGLAT